MTSSRWTYCPRRSRGPLLSELGVNAVFWIGVIAFALFTLNFW